MLLVTIHTFEHYWVAYTSATIFLVSYLINLNTIVDSHGVLRPHPPVLSLPHLPHTCAPAISPSQKLMISHTSKVHHPLISCVIGALPMRQVMDQLCTLKTTGICILLSSLDADFASYKVTVALKGSECDRSEKKTFLETISTIVWGEGKCGSSPPIYGVNENGGQNCPL